MINANESPLFQRFSTSMKTFVKIMIIDFDQAYPLNNHGSLGIA